jgi:hypothetical protein
METIRIFPSEDKVHVEIVFLVVLIAKEKFMSIIHVMTHTHWDREWFLTAEHTIARMPHPILCCIRR